MKNFYYVLTFNLTNPKVKRYLEEVKLTATLDSMVDFKIRSKIFISFDETAARVHEDFEKKLKPLFGSDNKLHKIRVLTLLNPAYAMGISEEMMSQLLERFGGNAINDWDENCCGTFFFLNDPTEGEDDEYHPNDWMFKYEIFVSEDSMELGMNGDFAFASSRNFTSTYH